MSQRRVSLQLRHMSWNRQTQKKARVKCLRASGKADVSVSDEIGTDKRRTVRQSLKQVRRK